MSDEKANSVSDAYRPVDAGESKEATLTGKSIFKDRSFWGMLTTQFLGAFNDNLYKQLMLLLAVPVVAAAAVAGQGEQTDVQGWATLVFSLPFVLFSGFAGFLSDRYSKTPIINLCKVAEVVVMVLGVAAFYYFDALGNWGTWLVLFLMGTQSSFFGPGKYGILPELFREEDLPRANSLMLMTTFLAIIFGTVLAGGLKDLLTGSDGSAKNLWIGMTICVGIAVVGALTSLLVRRVPPAQPQLKFTPDTLGVARPIYHYLVQDKALLMALIVSSIFWLVSGIAVPTVNRLGRWLGVNDTMTSLLTASIGLGIMAGALVASRLCRRGWGDRCVTIGLLGMCGCLVLLGCWSGGAHVLGFGGSLAALLSLGVFAAIFAIPIQVFIQSRPPAELKGRMVATMNQANFIGILSSGPIYQVFESIAGQMGVPISSVFWMMAGLVLPVGLLYRLDSTPLSSDGSDAAASDNAA